MLSALKSRRGATLAEIIVALALVSIMITMAVTFVFLITQRTEANAANDALQRDRQLVESGVERWLDAVLAKGDTISSPSEDYTEEMIAGAYSLKFAYGTLTGTLPEGKDLTLHTENVIKVEFSRMESSGDSLFFCKVTSEDPESGEQVTFTFCVNPRVGEGV